MSNGTGNSVNLMPKAGATHTPRRAHRTLPKWHIKLGGASRRTNARTQKKNCRWQDGQRSEKLTMLKYEKFKIRKFIPISWTATTFARLSDDRIYASHNRRQTEKPPENVDPKIGIYHFLDCSARRRLMRLLKSCVHSTPSANEYNLDHCLILSGTRRSHYITAELLSK